MAKRFRFRLETVQRLRKTAVDLQRRAVATAEAERVQVQAAIDRIQEELVQSVRQSESRRLGRLRMDELRQDTYQCSNLRVLLEQADTRLAQRLTHLAEERRKLAEVRTRLRVIEKLRERQWDRFRRDRDREEQASADEATVQRFLRVRSDRGVAVPCDAGGVP